MESCINATDEIINKISKIQKRYKSGATLRYFGIIYKLISPNKDVYIGKTVSLGFRFYCYKRYCRGGKIGQCIEKYGWDNFEKKILYTTAIEKNIFVELNQKEKYYISLFDSFHNGLNMTPGGDGGGFVNHKHSDETKKKMSCAARNCSNEKRERLRLAGRKRKFTEETRKKMSAIHKGKKISDETKRKMSLAHIGKKHSLEARKKISIGNNRARTNRSEETKEKMIERQKLAWVKRKAEGRDIVSVETREKLRKKSTGKKASKETREKISKAQIGKKRSEQAKIHNSEAQKRAWARRKQLKTYTLA